MKKQLLIVAIMAILGIFLSYDSGAQGWKRGHHKHYYKEQRRMEKAYRHGYYRGEREAYRDDCRPRRYYAQRPYYREHYRPYRRAGYRPYYAPRPYASGGVSINIPLPHPPLPPHPPFPPLP